jgi:predicted nucleic acid-binding protein
MASQPDHPTHTLVIDASALVDILLGRSISVALDNRAHLVSPAHLDAEVLSAIGRLVRGGHVEADDAEQMIDNLASAPIQRIPLAPTLGEAWSLRHAVALLDAPYVALAAMLDAPLVTTDARLATACTTRSLCAIA